LLIERELKIPVADKQLINLKTMKNILSVITIILLSSNAFSQVIIGNSTGTASNKTSVLLEFAANQNKGIILPYTRTLPSGANLQGGTIVLDVTDATKAKVKYYAPGNASADANGWVDLSNGHEANLTTPTNYMGIQPTATQVAEDIDAKAIIGADTSSADGVLVLESTTKAMVLPIVEDTANVPDPAPGMMVYINKAGAKRLAVYNGGGWTYWKP